MTKASLIMVIAVFGICKYTNAQQDCNCDSALNKDRIQIIQTENQVKTFLSIMTKENYEQYKSSGGFSLGIPIVDDMIKLSSDWSDFQIKRQTYFNQVDERWSMNKAYEELRIVTSSIAYDAWIKCIDICYGNKIAVYGWVERENDNGLTVHIKYNAPPSETKSLKLTGEIRDGSIVSGSKNLTTITGKIAPGETKTFLINRNPQNKKADFFITAGGYKGFSYYSTFQPLPPSRNVHASLELIRPNNEFIEVGPKCVYLTTPNLHEKRCDGCAVPYNDGKYEGANNSMFLQVGEGRILKNVTAPVCEGASPELKELVNKLPQFRGIIEETNKACVWMENMNFVVAQDGRSALATFRTSSRSTYWHFCGTEYIVKTGNQTQPINLGEIKAQSFTFKIPNDCTGAILKLKVAGNEYAINVGDSRPDIKVRFMSKIPTPDGTLYEYRVD